MANVVQVSIDLDLDSLKAGLTKAENAGAESGKKIGKNVGEGAEGGAAQYFKGLEKKLLAIGGLIAGAFSVKKIVEEAMNADSAIARMNAALNNAGSYSKAASMDFENFASQLQKSMGVEDSASMSLLALAKSFGVSNDKAKQMTETAINLAAATGMSLDSAMRQLGGTLDGSTGRLGKLAVGLKDMSPEALKAGGAIDYFQKRFAGSAAAQLDSFAGAIKSAQLGFSDILKEMGLLVTRSPVLTKAVAFIGEQFNKLSEYLQGFRKNGVDVVGQFFVKVMDVTNVLGKTLLPTLELVFNLGVALFKALVAGTSALTAGFFGIGYGIAVVQEKMGIMSAEGVANMKALFEASKAATVDLANDAANSFGEVMTFKGTEAANNFINSFQTAIGDGSAKLKDAGTLGIGQVQVGINEASAGLNFNEFTKQFEIAAQKGKSTMEGLSKSMYQIMVTGTTNLFVKMGEAWQNGQDVFAAFGKAVLGVFADLAIQLGSFYVSLGIANLFLNPAAAAAQLLGGFALLTLGGVLKALSGGGGGAPATAVTPSGGVATNNGANIGGDITNVSPQRNEPSQQINVHIQGNVLDRRQTGLEIADALMEAGFANGVVTS